GRSARRSRKYRRCRARTRGRRASREAGCVDPRRRRDGRAGRGVRVHAAEGRPAGADARGAEVMDDRPRYMISVAADLVGMHPQTLRIYENKGLIRPKRTAGNTRLYSEADLDRLRLIQQLTNELGLNLAGVEHVLRLQGMQQQPNVSAAFSRVLDKAADEASRMEDDYVSTEHLLLALNVVPRDQLEAKIKSVRGGQRVTSQDPEETYQALEKFGRDLTALAEQGKLDPVIGRDEEVRRVIQVLSRRTKNNPVLIGDPGVGKTAIVEGLAQRIVAG